MTSSRPKGYPRMQSMNRGDIGYNCYVRTSIYIQGRLPIYTIRSFLGHLFRFPQNNTKQNTHTHILSPCPTQSYSQKLVHTQTIPSYYDHGEIFRGNRSCGFGYPLFTITLLLFFFFLLLLGWRNKQTAQNCDENDSGKGRGTRNRVAETIQQEWTIVCYSIPFEGMFVVVVVVVLVGYHH